MNIYKVTIPEFTVEVEAENEGEAEVEAFELFNQEIPRSLLRGYLVKGRA